jgi:serine/threonine protein kinase
VSKPLKELVLSSSDEETMASNNDQTIDSTEFPEQLTDMGIGTWIGPYKLIQQLGEGGFGTVFKAEQKEPVQRMVALKIIKLGMDTKQVMLYSGHHNRHDTKAN